MRNLASIKRIQEVKPIENADNIQAYRVDWWWVVDRKGAHQVGDLVVYYEIDSFLPVRDEFEFLRKSSFKDVYGLGQGFRLKTIKLRGQISQGLITPVSVLSGLIEDCQITEDLDVTEALGVKKYEIPEGRDGAKLHARSRSNFPGFIQKTDQTRIQSIYNKIDLDQEWVATEKLDGSSMTVYFNDGKLGVCSRNFDIDIEKNPDNAFVATAIKTNVLVALERLGCNFAVQGELCGPGIQKNRYRLSEHKFFVYDIWDIDYQRYLDFHSYHLIFNTLANCCDIDIVPTIINEINLKDVPVSKILSLAEGESDLNKTEREGLVFKTVDYYRGQVVSFKAISNKFLLAGGE